MSPPGAREPIPGTAPQLAVALVASSFWVMITGAILLVNWMRTDDLFAQDDFSGFFVVAAGCWVVAGLATVVSWIWYAKAKARGSA